MIKSLLSGLVLVFAINTIALAAEVPYTSAQIDAVMAELQSCGYQVSKDTDISFSVTGAQNPQSIAYRTYDAAGNPTVNMQSFSMFPQGFMLPNDMREFPDTVECSASGSTDLQITTQAPVGTNLKLCRIGLKRVHGSELLVDEQIVKYVTSDASGYEVYNISDPNNPPTDIHVKFGGANYNAGYYVEYCWFGEPNVDTGVAWLGFDATFLSDYNSDSSSTAENYLESSEPVLNSELMNCLSQMGASPQPITDLSVMGNPHVGTAGNGTVDGSCSLRVIYKETSETPRSSSMQTGWLQIVPGVESHGDGNI